MDRNARAQMLLTQEDLVREIAELKQRLAGAGRTLSAFAHRLERSPERITFVNAPEPFNAIPMELLGSTDGVDWPSFPALPTIAADIQALRVAEKKLAGVRRQLGS